MPDRWQPGERITLRYVGHADLKSDVPRTPGNLTGWPYIVVEDSDDWLALWMPVGTRVKCLDLKDRARPVPDQIHGEHPTLPFRRGEVLRLMRPGQLSSIWLHWGTGPDRPFLGWYVNIEAPYERTPIGVDTSDLSLDLVVWPNLTYEWKDEHLEQRLVDLDIHTPEENRLIRLEGERVIADVEARRPPFDGAFLDWRPPSTWTTPEVHEGWELHPNVAFPLFTRRRLTGVDPAYEAIPR